MTGDFVFGVFVGAMAVLVTGFVIRAYQARRSVIDDNFRGDQWH